MDFSTPQELFMSLQFSQAMKKCIVETNWRFSDFDIASLIYNFPFRMTHSETTKLIETIASLTTDENLKKQIQQRIVYDKRVIEEIKRTDANCVFLLKYDDDSLDGIYGEFETAFERFDVKYGGFSIEKYQVLSKYTKPLVNKHHTESRNMNAEHQTNFDVTDDVPEKLGGIKFTSNREILYAWGGITEDELTREVANLDSTRFENAFIELPTPFKYGDKVRSISHNWTAIYSVKEDVYQKTIERAKRDKFLDCTDMAVTVTFPEEGEDAHCHISLFDLEFE